MRRFLIILGLIVVLGAAAFVYLLSVADGLQPPEGQLRHDVDIHLPR